MSLEREVEQMIDEMMKKEGWTRSHALSILRSKFESEERHQEVVYVNNLLKREETEEHTNDKDKKNSNTDFQKDY
ncbi:MAG: hypothetical protein ACJ712_07955 [Nitrososphaeraceae archaeon]